MRRPEKHIKHHQEPCLDSHSQELRVEPGLGLEGGIVGWRRMIIRDIRTLLMFADTKLGLVHFKCDNILIILNSRCKAEQQNFRLAEL